MTNQSWCILRTQAGRIASRPRWRATPRALFHGLGLSALIACAGAWLNLWFGIGLAVLCAIVIGIAEIVERVHLRGLARDPGSVIFEKAEELLVLRACEWVMEREGPWTEVWRLPGAGIAVADTSCLDREIAVAVFTPTGGKVPTIKPERAWAARLKAALDRMKADQKKAAHLTSICDAVERLGESNVIQFKRGDIA
jgi:hypothetical protein